MFTTSRLFIFPSCQISYQGTLVEILLGATTCQCERNNRMQSHPSNQGTQIIYINSQMQKNSIFRCFQRSSLEIPEIILILLPPFSHFITSEKNKQLRKFHMHLRKYLVTSRLFKKDTLEFLYHHVCEIFLKK